MRTGDHKNTPRGRMWGIAAAFVCAAGIGGYALLPLLVPHDLVRDRIDQQIEQLTGGSLKLREDTKVTVTRGFGVTVSDLVFVSSADSPSDIVIKVSQLDAQLRRLALLNGRVEIARLSLLEPDIQLGENDAPLALWPDVVQAQGPGATRPVAPADIVIVDGTLGFDHHATLSQLDLSITPNFAEGGLRMNGGFVMGASRMDIDLHMDNRQQLFADGAADGVLSVRFEPEGTQTNTDPDAADVTLVATAKNLLRSVGLIGPGPLVIDGQFAWKPRQITVSDATFSTAGLTMDGHLDMRAVGERTMAVQLHQAQGGSQTAITELADAVQAGAWPDARVSTHWLDGLHIDFDLHGAGLLFGDAILDTAAVSFAARDRAVSLKVKGQSAQFGSVAARLDYDDPARNRATAPRVTFSGQINEASMGDIIEPISRLMLPRLTGAPQMPEGTLAAQFDLYGRGRTLGQIVDSLNGSVTASLEDGSLTGGDVIATLETLSKGRQFMTAEKGPLIPAAGRTPFDTVKGRAGVRAGRAEISQLTIAGDRFEIDMLGEVFLKRGLVDMVGNAHLFAAPETEQTAAIKGVNLPFGIGGPVFAPVVGAGVPSIDAVPQR